MTWSLNNIPQLKTYREMDASLPKRRDINCAIHATQVCPGFDSRTRRHMWAEFVGSLLCSERFSPGTPVFPSLQKPTFDLIWFDLLPRQWGLGLVFGFLFFFPRSVTNRCLVSRAHASLLHAYGTDLRHMEFTEVVVAWKARFLGRWDRIQTNTPFAVDQH